MNLIKQPNGKYCIHDYRTGPKINLSEEDVIEIYIQQAKEAMNTAAPAGKLIEDLLWKSDENIDNLTLAAMGYDKPFEELVKYVPRKPLNQSYASCDFATYGKCPNCSKTVQDGMSHRDEKCPRCGQILLW